jgi:hypothetical protein
VLRRYRSFVVLLSLLNQIASRPAPPWRVPEITPRNKFGELVHVNASDRGGNGVVDILCDDDISQSSEGNVGVIVVMVLQKFSLKAYK